MSKYVEEGMILKCKMCANQDCSRDEFPCKRCSDNEQFTSHYKAHRVYQEILNAGAMISFPKTASIDVCKPYKATGDPLIELGFDLDDGK